MLKTSDGPPTHDPRITQLPSITASSSSPAYTTHAGLLLSRPPLLTRELSPFEKSFFFYQKRLNERLAMPFSRYFYFKKGTPADADWKLKAKERGGQPARELGGYNAYGEEGWNDELLVGDGLSETGAVVESLVRDSEVRAVEGKGGQVVEVGEKGGDRAERPLGRRTGADESGDVRRLDRRLGRTLYLLVKGGGEKGKWRFPAGRVEGRENLHQVCL
jgi:large subunit ribosomal protein L46